MSELVYSLKSLLTVLNVIGGLFCFGTGIINLVFYSDPPPIMYPIAACGLVVVALLLWFNARMLWE